MNYYNGYSYLNTLKILYFFLQVTPFTLNFPHQEYKNIFFLFVCTYICTSVMSHVFNTDVNDGLFLILLIECIYLTVAHDVNYSTAAVREPLRDEKPQPRRRKAGDPRFTNYRFAYQDFLPDPNPVNRNWIREKLERKDMLARRSKVEIPEFYVGSILSVTYSEPHAPGKINKFVGICIERKGCGLRSTFNLRNVIDHQGVEINFTLYDPCLVTIECLRY